MFDEHRQGPCRLVRAILALLALVLLLGVADPSPRFLGLHRQLHRHDELGPAHTVTPVLAKFDVPDGDDDIAPSGHHLVHSLRLAAIGAVAVSNGGVLAAPAGPSPRSVPDGLSVVRSGSGPPRRC